MKINKQTNREVFNIKKDIEKLMENTIVSLDKNNKFNKDKLIKEIEEANKDFIIYDRRFEFSIHDETKQITVKILDTITNEVIKEIPPEEILDVLAGLWEVAGILVDEEV